MPFQNACLNKQRSQGPAAVAKKCLSAVGRLIPSAPSSPKDELSPGARSPEPNTAYLPAPGIVTRTHLESLSCTHHCLLPIRAFNSHLPRNHVSDMCQRFLAGLLAHMLGPSPTWKIFSPADSRGFQLNGASAAAIKKAPLFLARLRISAHEFRHNALTSLAGLTAHLIPSTPPSSAGSRGRGSASRAGRGRLRGGTAR